MLKSSRGNRKEIRKWSIASVIRAAGSPQGRIFHARCEEESLRFPTFLLFETSSKNQVQFRRANSPQLRQQLQLPVKQRKNRSKEIAVAHRITASIAHLLIRRSQHCLNDHNEQVMLKTTSPHLGPLLKRYNTSISPKNWRRFATSPARSIALGYWHPNASSLNDSVWGRRTKVWLMELLETELLYKLC